jgi:hypothetical protein
MRVPSIEDLVRIATDAEPDAGDWAPDLILGPVAAEADPYTLRVAVAWGSAVPVDGPSALERWARDKAAPADLRAGMHAILRAPWLSWRVRSDDGAVAELESVDRATTGIARWRRPATPFGPGTGVLTAVVDGEMIAPILVPEDALRPGAGPDMARETLTERWRRG